MKQKIEDYLENAINSKPDKNNTFHPDQIDKLQDIETIKVYYRAVVEGFEFRFRNLAINYLNAVKGKK